MSLTGAVGAGYTIRVRPGTRRSYRPRHRRAGRWRRFRAGGVAADAGSGRRGGGRLHILVGDPLQAVQVRDGDVALSGADDAAPPPVAQRPRHRGPRRAGQAGQLLLGQCDGADLYMSLPTIRFKPSGLVIVMRRWPVRMKPRPRQLLNARVTVARDVQARPASSS